MASMGERLHKESLFSHMDYDEETFITFLRTMMQSPYGFFWCIVDQEQDIPIGMLLATLQKTYFGKDFIATDLILVVDKERRGTCGTAFVSLVNEYKQWAFKMGAKRVYLGSSSGVDPEATENILERAGFHKVGSIHEA